jgi:hypothetical protein
MGVVPEDQPEMHQGLGTWWQRFIGAARTSPTPSARLCKRPALAAIQEPLHRLLPLNNDADDRYAGTTPARCFASNG